MKNQKNALKQAISAKLSQISNKIEIKITLGQNWKKEMAEHYKLFTYYKNI